MNNQARTYKLPLSKRINTSLKQPKEIYSYSIDIHTNVHMDDRSLAYYYLTDSWLDRSLDLFSGFKDFQQKDESKPLHLDTLLMALMSYEGKTGTKVKTDIISWRGIMTKLMCLPYENSDDMDLNVMVFDGQIFIEEDHKLTTQKKRPMDQQGELLCYSGFKFEQVATISKPWSHCTREEIEGHFTAPVNNIEQYVSVVRTGVGKVGFVLGGEVDCAKDYKPQPPESPLSHYVELKTSKVVRSDRDAKNFERKILKSWAQSFLLGVPKIVYGFRNDNGILDCVEEYKTEAIPTIVKNSTVTPPHRKWNGMDAIAFYGAALEWIKDTVTSDNNVVIWRLSFKAKQDEQLVLRKLSSDESEDFLLPEFKQWRQSLDRQGTQTMVTVLNT
jgi:RAT1-interacting protein